MPVSTDDIQKALGGLHAGASDTLANFFKSLDLGNPAQARNDLLEFMPMLTEQYGLKASAMAADWFDELRLFANEQGMFVTEMGAVIPGEFVQKRVRFGAQHLWTDAPADLLPFLQGAVSGWVTEAFNGTLQMNANADRTCRGWARKPEPGACKWCLMLASRVASDYYLAGPYVSREAATEVQGRGTERNWSADKRGRFAWRGDGIKARGAQAVSSGFHDNCRCVAIPFWQSTDFQGQHGFDPEDLLRRYERGEFEGAAEYARNQPWRDRQAAIDAAKP